MRGLFAAGLIHSRFQISPIALINSRPDGSTVHDIERVVPAVGKP
jgi:hypothetical protein